MSDDPARPDDWPLDTAHKAAHDVIDSIARGRLTKPARQAVRRALDQAEAPLTGRPKQDHALGRALRLRHAPIIP